MPECAIFRTYHSIRLVHRRRGLRAFTCRSSSERGLQKPNVVWFLPHWHCAGQISPLERGFKSSYSRYRHRYYSPRHHRIVNATRPDRWPRYLQYIRGSHHPPKAGSLGGRGREAEEGTVRGSNNLSQERKAVLSAGLGSSALGTTEAVHPDRRMLTLRRTRLAYR